MTKHTYWPMAFAHIPFLSSQIFDTLRLVPGTMLGKNMWPALPIESCDPDMPDLSHLT